MCTHDTDVDTNMLKEPAKRKKGEDACRKGLKDSFVVELVLPSAVLASHLLSRQPDKEEWIKGDGRRKISMRSARLYHWTLGTHCCNCVAIAFGLLLKRQFHKLGRIRTQAFKMRNRMQNAKFEQSNLSP